MKLKVEIYFCDDDGEKFFGEGPYRLLRGVEELGSLRAAASDMGMGYTKAFHLIKRAEEQFGFPLTQRKIGGKGGGGSMLTPAAKELLMRYEGYKTSGITSIQNLYHTHFSTFRPEKYGILSEPAAEDA